MRPLSAAGQLRSRQRCRQEHAMAVPRIPAVRRRASVVLLGDPKADEMPAARLADRWHTLGFFPKACGLLRSHGCNEPAPPGIVDKRRRTSRGSLVIGSPLS